MRPTVHIVLMIGVLAITSGCSGDGPGGPPWAFGADADETAVRDTSADLDGGPVGDTSADADAEVLADDGARPVPSEPVIAAGGSHSCAVVPSGEIRCWGQGLLGDGTDDGSPTPVTVEEISNATDVAAGLRHTCSVLRDGGLRCWGESTRGQLKGGFGNESAERPVGMARFTREAVDIAAGQFHACAALRGGEALCWGGSVPKEALGKDSNPKETFAVEVEGLPPAEDLAAGYFHSCAVVEGGGVRCWGSNRWGQIGNGERTAASEGPRIPVEVEAIAPATQIAAGEFHTCAVLRTGEVRCWGKGEWGQLGNGESGGAETWQKTEDDYWSGTPVPVEGITKAVDVAAGRKHNCAVLEGGEVQCWGRGQAGQLGNGVEGRGTNSDLGDDYFSATPVRVKGITSAVDVAAGKYHSCAMLEGGEARCWGADRLLGREPASDDSDSTTPTPVAVDFE